MDRLDQMKRSVGRKIADFFTGERGSIFWVITVVWNFCVELIHAINEAIAERRIVNRRRHQEREREMAQEHQRHHEAD